MSAEVISLRDHFMTRAQVDHERSTQEILDSADYASWALRAGMEYVLDRLEQGDPDAAQHSLKLLLPYAHRLEAEFGREDPEGGAA